MIDDNQSIHEDFRKILATTKTGSTQLDDFEATFFGPASQDAQQPTFVIDSALQGEEGLDLVRRALKENRPYPMAFVDMRMPPGWDGIETISRIWKEYPELEVVICTAYSDYSWEEMQHKLGNSDRVVLLKKPFDCVEVLKLAQTLTDKWQAAQQAKKNRAKPSAR